MTTLLSEIDSVACGAGAAGSAVSYYDYGSHTAWSYRGTV